MDVKGSNIKFSYEKVNCVHEAKKNGLFQIRVEKGFHKNSKRNPMNLKQMSCFLSQNSNFKNRSINSKAKESRLPSRC